MDQQTLTNHLVNTSKNDFDVACKIVLQEFFDLKAINVDGPSDGGTDFVSFNRGGSRNQVGYQATTQKNKIKIKAFNDAKKNLEKLGATRFYFFTSQSISETTARRLENDIFNEIGIPSTCFGAKHVAGILLEENLLNIFLDKTNSPLPRNFATSPDYREMALHAYTVMSGDTRNMRDGIYDDTILFVLSSQGETAEKDLPETVLTYLKLEESRYSYIQNRVGALFGKQLIRRTSKGNIVLTDKANTDIDLRKRIYEKELEDLSAAQIDLMRNEFNFDWTVEDSKQISIYIAGVYIEDQIKLLKEIDSKISIHPVLNIQGRGIDSLKEYLLNTGKIPPGNIDLVSKKLVNLASNHPLVTKLARASVYVALEGSSPIVSAKVLGAGRWSDYRILIETTVAIPWICTQLFSGHGHSSFASSKQAIKRAKKLGASLHITYFYLNECAAHLLRARNYDGIELSPEELCYSPNAFISNYYSLKKQGIKVPESLMEYLKIFSPSVLVKRQEMSEWVRTVMTDVQSILNRSGIKFVESPKYTHHQSKFFEQEYTYYLNKIKSSKPIQLINHDVWALQFTNDSIADKGEHWLILTYDKSIINVSKVNEYSGWVSTPERFLDLTSNYGSLTEAQYVTLVHSFATYSEKTLSAGARIIDKVIQYASVEMQEWEFKNKFDQFKNNLVSTTDLDSINSAQNIDKGIDEFLRTHGLHSIKKRAVKDLEVD